MDSPDFDCCSSLTPHASSLLLSEGSSLSARHTISALGPLGYRIDLCDPNPLCLGRFSRFIRAFYRSPAVGTDPLGYLRFIVDHLQRHRYDVLLPVHEQAFLFSRFRDRIPAQVGLAVADFDAFAILQSKAGFVGLLAQLGLPHPPTRLVRSRSELEAPRPFPYYIKAPYGTAGCGVWRVGNLAERSAAVARLDARGLLDGQTEVLVQDVAAGVLSVAQAVFDRGRLLAAHCCRLRAEGVGGSACARVGVDQPIVRGHLEQLGRHLNWHGGLMLDYLFDPASGRPAYIEANPRLGETMNARFSGINLPEVLVRLSLGAAAGADRAQPGVRSHSLMTALLGIAGRGGSRSDLIDELARAIAGRGIYAGSQEELTPIGEDPPSLVPLAAVIAQLGINPRSAGRIAAGAIAAYALTPAAVRTILSEGA